MVNQITITASKSTRSNSKRVYKDFLSFYGGDQEGMKKIFTSDNMKEVEQWLKNTPYDFYHLGEWHNDFCLFSYNYKIFDSIEKMHKTVVNYMELLNTLDNFNINH